jgi:hypothetical protein
MEAWAADVDAFFGVVGGGAGDVVYRASARDRLAGRWLGCYAQPVAAFGPMWDFELVSSRCGTPRVSRRPTSSAALAR